MSHLWGLPWTLMSKVRPIVKHLQRIALMLFLNVYKAIGSMAKHYNFIYEELVRYEGDLVGRVAYSLYKREKIAFIEQ